MAERIDISKARQGLPELVRRVEDGESFHLTRYGKVVAVLLKSDEISHQPMIRAPIEPDIKKGVGGGAGSITAGGGGGGKSTTAGSGGGGGSVAGADNLNTPFLPAPKPGAKKR